MSSIQNSNDFQERFMCDYSIEEQKLLFTKMLEDQLTGGNKSPITPVLLEKHSVENKTHRPVTPPLQNVKRPLQSPYSPHRSSRHKVIFDSK